LLTLRHRCKSSLLPLNRRFNTLIDLGSKKPCHIWRDSNKAISSRNFKFQRRYGSIINVFRSWCCTNHMLAIVFFKELTKNIIKNISCSWNLTSARWLAWTKIEHLLSLFFSENGRSWKYATLAEWNTALTLLYSVLYDNQSEAELALWWATSFRWHAVAREALGSQGHSCQQTLSFLSGTSRSK